MRRLVLSLAIVSSLAACGGSSQKTTKGTLTPRGPAVEYPEWVNKGAAAYPGEQGVLYGVGSSGGIKQYSLARSSADNRARAEIQKIFQTYTASLMKDYQSSTTGGDMSASEEQQRVERAIKTFTAGTLHGVEIVDHWVHPNGEIFSLARLDLDRFEGMFARNKELSEKIKERVKRSSERAFADLEAEEAKRLAQ